MFDELMARIAGRFGRVEPRRRARSFVLGLLAELSRKNCWSIAEHAGDTSPDGMQRLLGRARWAAGAVRDDLRDYVVERLGDPGAVLVIDETGDVKKGRRTAGVQRQYTGTAGRTGNAPDPPQTTGPPNWRSTAATHPATSPRRARQGRGAAVDRGRGLPGRQGTSRPR
jgi:SRSO17 transposase